MKTLTIKFEEHNIGEGETQWLSWIEGDDTYKALVITASSIPESLKKMAVSIEVLHKYLNKKG